MFFLGAMKGFSKGYRIVAHEQKKVTWSILQHVIFNVFLRVFSPISSPYEEILHLTLHLLP